MRRRQFLKTAAALTLPAALPLSARVWAAQNPNGPKFILVFLRGAYDCANLLVPYASDFYYRSRPHIAVPRPGGGAGAAIALDRDWALHPALGTSLFPLWQARQMAFVPYAGTRDLSRSHFETQDHIELGQGPAPHDFNDGFLSRLAGQVGGRVRPMAFSGQLPLSFRGPRQIPNLAIARTDAAPPPRQETLIREMWADTAESNAVNAGFAVDATVRHDMHEADWAREMRAASRGAVAPHNFVGEAARIGLLMRDSFDLGFIDVGGWDTHVNEAGANGSEGQLADRLSALGQGLAALARTMGPAWNRTTMVVLSEFGRTFRENGDRGTDHGHGSVYWVLGGAVKGGRIKGPQIALSPATLNQNRDYPVLTDYRDLLGGLFTRLWGLDRHRVEAVFPGSRPKDLGLV